MPISIKRVYEPRARGDGYRVLIDRVWPRGLTKDAAAIDLWLKDAAPSTELRRWFGHDPKRWKGFRQKYFRELAGCEEILAPLLERARKGRLTIVYGAREERFNNAVVLKAWLEARL